MTPAPFIHELTIRLHDTDAAGVLFFGHLFRHLHDAYESFMAEIGFPLHALIRPPDPRDALALPIVHASADYAEPLRQGDAVRVLLGVAEVRGRSFALDYQVLRADGRVCARARTLHVAAPSGSGAPSGLPRGLHAALLARVAGSPPEGQRSAAVTR